MKIKITMVFCLIFGVLALFFLPIPLHPAMQGAYNTWSGMIWCENKSNCLHEIGHGLDDESGWISNSDDFTLAIEGYTRISKENGAWLVVSYPDIYGLNPFGQFKITNGEMYAYLFEWSNGQEENMPEIFREFYDWERAKFLIEKIEFKANETGYPIWMTTWPH